MKTPAVKKGPPARFANAGKTEETKQADTEMLDDSGAIAVKKPAPPVKPKPNLEEKKAPLAKAGGNTAGKGAASG
jgi:hypothetical protein